MKIYLKKSKEDFISERDYKCIIFCLCGDERIVEILKIY